MRQGQTFSRRSLLFATRGHSLQPYWDYLTFPTSTTAARVLIFLNQLSASHHRSGVHAVSVQQQAMPLQVLCRDDQTTFAMIKNILVVVGRGTQDRASALNARQCVIETVNQHPQGIGIITLSDPGSTPVPDARDILLSTYKQHAKDIHAALFVLAASGFEAAVQRSIIGAASLLMNQRDRVKIVNRLTDGAEWFVGRLPRTAQHDSTSAAALAGLVHRFVEAERLAG